MEIWISSPLLTVNSRTDPLPVFLVMDANEEESERLKTVHPLVYMSGASSNSALVIFTSDRMREPDVEMTNESLRVDGDVVDPTVICCSLMLFAPSFFTNGVDTELSVRKKVVKKKKE